MSSFEVELKAHYERCEKAGLYDRKKHAYTSKFYATELKKMATVFYDMANIWYIGYKKGERPLRDVYVYICDRVNELNNMEYRFIKSFGEDCKDRAVFVDSLKEFYKLAYMVSQEYKDKVQRCIY